MLKILPISDLHLDFLRREEFPIPTVGADVLVIAGDLFVYQNEGVHSWVISYLKELSNKFPIIFYVLGNHEYYKDNILYTKDNIEKLLKINNISNIHILTSKSSFEVNKYIFLGDTLWTNCNNNNEFTKSTILDGLNDYHLIKSDKQNHILTPDDTYLIHKQTLKDFEEKLNYFNNREVIMITHHSPSFSSVSDKYKDYTHLNGGFVSNLDSFILKHPQIKCWFHGHVHDSFNYNVGSTKVICNPLGYPRRYYLKTTFENTQFDINFVVKL